MTSQVYKTAQGKSIDMGALRLQNENVRAVGNMNINARGDILDDQNQIISTKNQQLAQQYKQTVQNNQGSQ